MKSFLGPGNSSSAAADEVLKPVVEGDLEDDEVEASPDESKPSSTDEVTPKDSSSSSSFNLAAKETTMIKYSKGLLILLILLVAAGVAYATYKLVRDQETNNYKTSFYAIAEEVSEFSQLKAQQILDQMERLCVHVTSTAASSQQAWPFVVIPDFQVKGMMFNDNTGTHTLSISPLVYPHHLEPWTSFSKDRAQGWIEKAHEYDTIVNEELYEMDFYNVSQEDDYLKPEHKWDEIGVTPYVWTTEGGEKASADAGRRPVGKALLYSPLWQRAPAADFSPLVNYDMHSDYHYAKHIDGMLAADHPVITEVVEATYLQSHYDHRFDRQEQNEPHSYLMEPIYDNLLNNRTAVAIMAAFLRWGVFFENVLPDSEQGLYVVLEATCGNNTGFTYEIFGHKAVFIGQGDKHERSLDDEYGGHLEHTFEFLPDSAVDKSGDHEFCHYYAHVFPSSQWRSTFFTDRPYTYAVAVVCCFLVATFAFLAYDWLVQRRQDKVMTSAKRTNAIVNSLFPENVRDRLMEGLDDANDKDGNKSGVANPGWSNSNDAKRGSITSAASSAVTSELIFGSKPIADLFPETTIMFCDMVGFTAWSSVRDPSQVFSLLETVYHNFDRIAKRRRIFKVETIGDCYVAVAGLPMPQKNHAVIMAKYANDCLHKMKELVHKLETHLGPDTADLNVRIGLHSGPVTAGVLRGDKGRFQLFGDTMNTASRLESTGQQGKIHVSRDTAELLVGAGKEKWVTQREDQVIAKGKGVMQTYWVNVHVGSCSTGSRRTNSTSLSGPDVASKQTDLAKKLALGPDMVIQRSDSAIDNLSPKKRRLVHWNAEILLNILRQIIARRASLGQSQSKNAFSLSKSSKKKLEQSGTVLDEVKDILALPQFDARTFQNHVDPDKVEIPAEVSSQLTDLLARIAALYRDNDFHSFEHASHVTMSVTKLLSRIVNPVEVSTRESSDEKIAADLHDHTFGITSDPLTHFACVLAALIHDADHLGVPNSILVKEDHPLASKYKNKSVAEQNSVDLAWDIIMSEDYKDLQACIYGSNDELERFRSIIVNVVMATDIMDKDLGAQRKARWEKAFAQESEEEAKTPLAINRKATIVLEHLMQASDVSHTMQHWVVFQKWNERLFKETYRAYLEGHSDRDPSEGWYQGELGFFDYYIIPLAKKLETCGVFGVSSHEYLSYAQANRREWEEKGEQIIKDYLARFHNSLAKNSQQVAGNGNKGASIPFTISAVSEVQSNQTSVTEDASSASPPPPAGNSVFYDEELSV